MNKNLTHILIGEVHSAAGYLERIFHVAMDVMPYGNTPELKTALATTYFELTTVLEDQFFALSLKSNTAYPHSGRELRQKILQCSQLVENALKLDINPGKVLSLCTQYINVLYNSAYQLHLLAFKLTSLDIQYPRLNLIEAEEVYSKELSKGFFRFRLPEEKLAQLSSDTTEIISLKVERERKHHQLLQKAQEALFSKDNNLAINLLNKARNLIETAEVLTLIGWSYSQQKELEKAKTFCLKAIQLDPNYGPPYNDLGNFLLQEGQINESLKWFNLAKKTSHFQNKEYPYINAGRAYIMKKDYQLALEEFSIALTIAPHLDELHQTVERLRHGLDRGNEIFDKLSDHLNNQSDDHLTT